MTTRRETTLLLSMLVLIPGCGGATLPEDDPLRVERSLEGQWRYADDYEFANSRSIGQFGTTLTSHARFDPERLPSPAEPQGIQLSWGDEEVVDLLRVSPDGRWLLSRGGSTILLTPTQHGPVRGLVLHDMKGSIDCDLLPSFSPDSQWAACPTSEGLHLWRLRAGRTAFRVMVPLEGYCGAAVFAPDSSAVIYFSETEVRYLEIPSAEHLKPQALLSLKGKREGARLAVSPDGSWLWVALYDGRCRIGRLDRTAKGLTLSGMRATSPRVNEEEAPINAVAFSSKGNWVLAGGRLWPFDTQQGEGGGPQRLATVKDATGGFVGFGGPGGSYVWIGSTGDVYQLWEIGRSNKARPVVEASGAIAVSPREGLVLCLQEDSTEIYVRSRRGLGAPVFRLPEVDASALAFSSDGSRIYVGTTGGEIKVLDSARLFEDQVVRLGEDTIHWGASKEAPAKAPTLRCQARVLSRTDAAQFPGVGSLLSKTGYEYSPPAELLEVELKIKNVGGGSANCLVGTLQDQDSKLRGFTPTPLYFGSLPPGAAVVRRSWVEAPKARRQPKTFTLTLADQWAHTFPPFIVSF